MMSIFETDASVSFQLARKQARTKDGSELTSPVFSDVDVQCKGLGGVSPVPIVTASASVGRLL